ncbi:DUF3857 domain-containing protein [Polaribacter sp. Hel1_85]|uniref:DUF3857 domain-containing protein n=1 Tax=Polaribacter sp. Hel1_85 TaxID=1250005 RepID=UPI00052C3691|nr:DUF3857 domain-containing protein [Polaribacter sp. Hel1_85]KGL58831.1 hypothetical protein PHEL85_3102 [Polaribacter sp. Hel1_85]
MKKIIPLCLLVSLFSIVATFSQKNNYSSLLIPVELKENANAVIRDNSIEITIEDVDEMVVRNRKVVTVLNKLGDRNVSMSEYYDNHTKITKLSAIIYDAFGSQLKKYSKNKFLDVSAVDGGTLYSDSRVKYVDYTPVSYPYTIVFESEYKTSTTGFIPSWYPISGYSVSVEKSEYKLVNPKRITIHKKEKNFSDYSIENSHLDYELNSVIKSQPAIKYEANSVSFSKIMPLLLVVPKDFQTDGVKGSYSNWKELGSWMNDKILYGKTDLDEATKLKVLNLVKGIDNPIEKAKIVYDYMQNKTRYISVQVGIGGIQPIAANQVDKVSYGDCKGLTNYTKALLDVVGVKSNYVHVEANRNDKVSFENDFASLAQGNHVILNIPNSGNDIWLECTSQTIPFGFLGDFTDDRNVLVMTPEGGVIKRTPSYKNETNLQEINGKIQLEENGNLTATLNRVSKGIQYDDKSFYETLNEEELIKRYKSNVWSYNNNLEITSTDIINDKEKVVLKEDLKVSIKNYASVNEQEYLFRVNVFNKNSFVPKRYRTRKLPLKIPRGFKDVDSYEFTLPKGYVLGVLPSEKTLSSNFGTYKVTFTKIDDTTFKYNKSMLIKEGVYPKEDYKKYRNFRRSIAKYENLRIAILKK